MPALVLAGVVVFITYKSKSQAEFYSKPQIILLSSLRFLSVFFLILLLLAPVVQWYQYHRLEPTIIVAIDNSSSMKNSAQESEGLVNKAKQELKGVKTDFWIFGEKANKEPNISFLDARSNYSDLFGEVENSYLPSSVSSMILIGDGIFNTGTDPVFSSQNINFPIYTVGVGDTTKQVDAAILKVVSNPTAFLDDLFPVEINLSFQQLAGKDSKLTIWQDRQLVYETNLTIRNNDFFQQQLVHLKAEKSGIVNYRIETTLFDSEKNATNNSYEFSIRVLDQKQKVLILEHGAHPDIAAITRVLDPQVNIEYDLRNDASGDFNLSKYNLVIMHQLPDANSANSPILQQLLNSRLPILWIFGTETSIDRLNSLQLGFTFENPRGYEYGTGSVNPQFNFFQTNELQVNQMKTWPPLYVPFADVTLSGDWQTLAFQTIQQVDMQRPLISLGRYSGVKTGLIAGEGIWRWRINDLAQNQSSAIFDDLFLKIINYLILKPNEDNFNLFYQTNYMEDQDVTLEAELLNESFEPVTDPEVSIQIKAESGLTYDYVFDKADNHYELNTGNLPVGTYSFQAATQLGDRKFTEEGSFRIDKLQLEQLNLQADFNLLYQIAANTGGEFIRPEKFEELLKLLKRQSELNENRVKQLVFKEFIAMKWLAFLILFLVSVEWFLRKFWGSY
ncbi:hypothetical protein [Mangrovibacterium diazotrophicum]|uniref:hypothetical protein n=1 Tax=Mangrovibacterium diazotrophicum TaxID=1261403 RepID=UPI0011C370C1|nr:hypothetical protein [Mangrovibacterium diazotrophicum]